MDDPWRFERVTLKDGLGMRVARAGAGPLVVMLHGFPECWYSWRHQIRALAPSFECAAPDLRGYGGSDAPRGVDNYTIDKLVGDVAGLVEELGHRSAIIVGHDWGGAIAWATALMRPELVERLIVMNCPHPARFREHIRRSPRQMLRSWYMLFFQLPYLPEAGLRMGRFAAMRRLIRWSAVNKEAFSDEDLDVFAATFAAPDSPSAAINYYRALGRSHLLGKLPPDHWIFRKIAAPTMLIWGERDAFLGKELTLEMEPLFEGPFELRYVADSGHWVQQERPEIVNRYMKEFLSGKKAA